MWFIFIQAHRFYARTADSPPRLAGGQAPGRSVVNRPIRRVGLSPTNPTTFTGCCGQSRQLEHWCDTIALHFVYALMANRFQQVIGTPQANLVAGMKWFL